jgi:hypothetical protein
MPKLENGGLLHAAFAAFPPKQVNTPAAYAAFAAFMRFCSRCSVQQRVSFRFPQMRQEP